MTFGSVSPFVSKIRSLGFVRYLSKEWIEAANAAVEAAADSAPEQGVIIDQHVSDTISYRIVIERNACLIAELDNKMPSPAADAVFRQNLDTAHAVAVGTTDAHQAFLLGQITFEGAIDVLIERRDAFGWLESTIAPVMAATTFD